jgi:polyisoprenoid-binding protein YceI
MKYILPLVTFLFFAGSISVRAGNLVIDYAQSTLTADVKASPPHRFTYDATQFNADIQIAPQTLAVNQAECSFKFADLDSEKAKRDKKMREWMNIAHYPDARFKLDKVLKGDNDDEHIGVGTFTMHGVSREIRITFTSQRNGDRILLDGSTTFNYTDWNLEIVRLFIFSVKPELTIHFHIEGTVQ